MICPSCGKSASSFYRFGFSLQGVSVRESMQGYLRCQHCGALLRVLNPGRFIWTMIAAALASIAGFLVAASALISLLGYEATRLLFFPVILIAGIAGVYLFWRSARIGVVTPPLPPDEPA